MLLIANSAAISSNLLSFHLKVFSISFLEGETETTLKKPLTLIHDQTFLTGYTKHVLPVRPRLSIVQVRFRWRQQQSIQIKSRVIVSSGNITINNEEQQGKCLALTPCYFSVTLPQTRVTRSPVYDISRLQNF